MTGAEIKAWRKSLGYTQKELGKILWVEEYTISRWETGRNKPRLISQKLIKEVYQAMNDPNKTIIAKSRQNWARLSLEKQREVSDGGH